MYFGTGGFGTVLSSWFKTRGRDRTRFRILMLARVTESRALARLLDRIGLDRMPTKVADLDGYIAERYGDKSQ